MRRNKRELYSAARMSATLGVTAITILATLLIAASPTAAVNRPITVSISRVHALDPVDSGSMADFFWYVTLSTGTVKSNEPYVLNDDDIDPCGWQNTWYLPAGSGQVYTFIIELWDDDGSPADDDLCDISNGYGSSWAERVANMQYYIDTGIWTGDDYQGDSNGYGHVSGAEDGSENPDVDQDDCEIWFSVSRK